jgi:hypothetical protein
MGRHTGTAISRENRELGKGVSDESSAFLEDGSGGRTQANITTRKYLGDFAGGSIPKNLHSAASGKLVRQMRQLRRRVVAVTTDANDSAQDPLFKSFVQTVLKDL